MRDLLIKHKNNKIKFNFLKWDTDFFGLNSFALDFPSLAIKDSSHEFLDKVKACINSSFIVAKVPLDCEYKLLDFLFDLNFKFISTELILLFRDNADFRDNTFLSNKLTEITLEKAKAVPADAYLLGKEFNFSRFHQDKKIAKKKADLLWVNYIKNFKLSKSRHLFIAKVDNKTIGGIFVEQYVENHLKVSNLFCVSLRKQYRGRDIGRALIKYSINWNKSHSDLITVGTQTNNIRALNFYLKNGFSKVKESRLILHRWS